MNFTPKVAFDKGYEDWGGQGEKEKDLNIKARKEETNFRKYPLLYGVARKGQFSIN